MGRRPLSGPAVFSKPVVLDNTVLSNFAIARQAGMLFKLWQAPMTTVEALREYQASVDLGKLPAGAWRRLAVVDLVEEERQLAEQHLDLGAGERTCLAVAALRGALLATDDRKARRTARELSIPVTGSPGILVLSVDAGVSTLEGANRIQQEMIRSGFFSPVSELETLM